MHCAARPFCKNVLGIYSCRAIGRNHKFCLPLVDRAATISIRAERRSSVRTGDEACPEALTSRASYLNGIVLALIYLLCVTLVNQFWAGTAIFATFVIVYGVATKNKITMRDKPIIPSDLDFLTGKGGGAGAVTSFVTSDSRKLITSSIIYLIFFILLCVGLQIIDKTPFIRCSWRHPLTRQSNIWALIARILAPFTMYWVTRFLRLWDLPDTFIDLPHTP